MSENVSFAEIEGVIIATLPAEIDHHIARGVREQIDGKLFLKKPSVLVLDFSRVKFMDSSGIGLILGRREIAESLGFTIRISGLSERNRRLVRLSGIERLGGVSFDN